MADLVDMQREMLGRGLNPNAPITGDVANLVIGLGRSCDCDHCVGRSGPISRWTDGKVALLVKEKHHLLAARETWECRVAIVDQNYVICDPMRKVTGQQKNPMRRPPPSVIPLVVGAIEKNLEETKQKTEMARQAVAQLAGQLKEAEERFDSSLQESRDLEEFLDFLRGDVPDSELVSE